MIRLLHVGASPRGVSSDSLQIAHSFIDAYRDTHPANTIETWDLWDGSLPAFGPAAAAAKVAIFADGVPQGDGVPGMVFDVDPHDGYSHLLEGKPRKAAVVYTSAVWGPGLGPEFGTNFQSTYFENWLRWTGITDRTQIRYHPTLTGATDDERRNAHATPREQARTF